MHNVQHLKISKIVHNVQNLRIVPMFKISKSFNYLSLRNVYNIQNLQIVHNVQKMSNKIIKLCKSKKSQNLKIVHNVQHLKISNIFHNVKNLEIFKLFLVPYKNSTLSKFFSNSELKNKVWRPKCLKYLKCINLKIVNNVQNLKILNLFMCN